ncbi:MAG: hypothetical protein H6R34_700, partial [Bacteroidetes bacterium]|nr:hypothetical protein [Bacteroidota bacterium]
IVYLRIYFYLGLSGYIHIINKELDLIRWILIFCCVVFHFDVPV